MEGSGGGRYSAPPPGVVEEECITGYSSLCCSYIRGCLFSSSWLFPAPYTAPQVGLGIPNIAKNAKTRCDERCQARAAPATGYGYRGNFNLPCTCGVSAGTRECRPEGDPSLRMLRRRPLVALCVCVRACVCVCPGLLPGTSVAQVQ